MKDIKVIELCGYKDFEKKINELLKDGYKIISSNCGVLSDEHMAESVYQAIMEKDGK